MFNFRSEGRLAATEKIENIKVSVDEHFGCLICHNLDKNFQLEIKIQPFLDHLITNQAGLGKDQLALLEEVTQDLKQNAKDICHHGKRAAQREKRTPQFKGR